MLRHKYKHSDFKIRAQPSVCSVGNINTTFRKLILCPSSSWGEGPRTWGLYVKTFWTSGPWY